MTTSLTASGGVSVYHFVRWKICGRYCTTHCFHIRFFKFWAIRHCLARHIFSSYGCGVCLEFVHPTKKLFGVIGSQSSASIGTSVSGREFIMFFASITTLLSVLSFGVVSLKVCCSNRLTVCINLSQHPPELGLAGQLKTHSM